MNGPDPLTLPNLPRDETGPVFAEPWQAQAFALVLQLHERGAFTWPEWAEALSRRLKATPDADGAQYYDRWLEALEDMTKGTRLAESTELATRKADWAAAYARTPHGKPVEL